MSPRPFKMRLGDFALVAVIMGTVSFVGTALGRELVDVQLAAIGLLAVIAFLDAREADWRAREAVTRYETLVKSLVRVKGEKKE